MKRSIVGGLLIVAACQGKSEGRSAGVPSPPCIGRDSVCELTFIQLVARPEVYDGRWVRTIGYLHLEPYDNGLYLSTESFQNTADGIWISVSDSIQKHPEAVNDRFVVVVGRYHAGHLGHLGMSFGGAIDSVTFLSRSFTRSDLSKTLQEIDLTPRKPK